MVSRAVGEDVTRRVGVCAESALAGISSRGLLRRQQRRATRDFAPLIALDNDGLINNHRSLSWRSHCVA